MGKRALVTGAAGFVGRHMVRELRARGWDVERCDISGPMAWTMHDVSDMVRWNTARYHLVVHAAAMGAHRAAIDGKPATFIQNAKMDAAIFDWAIRTKQHRLLYISSSAAYPVALQTSVTGSTAGARGYVVERLHEDEINLDAPELADGTYGVAKLMGEHLSRAARAFGVPVTVVRPFSGYGEDQTADWPFGAFVQRIRSGDNPFVIWGNPHQRRDWIHIDDVVKGMLAVADSGTEDPVNLCTGVGTSMFDLVDLMLATVGRTATIEADDSKPMGVMNRVGDPSRFFEYYEPTVTIEEGVHRALKEV